MKFTFMSLIKAGMFVLVLTGCIAITFGQSKVKVEKYRKIASQHMEFKEYKEALTLLVALDSVQENNAEVNYMLGVCYLNVPPRRKSYTHFLRAEKFGDQHQDLFLMLGKSAQLAHKFDKAIEYYEIYRTKAPDSDDVQIDKLVSQCEVGRQLVANPLSLKVNPLGKPINSMYTEYVPMLNAEGNEMVFTARTPSTTGGKMDDVTQEYFEDIYSSKRQNGKWTSPQNLGVPVNSKWSDACVAMNQDGKELLIYRGSSSLGRMSGDIYSSKYEDGESMWSEPKPLLGNINSSGFEPSACFIENGQKIIFSSNRPGGMGGLDLYVATKTEDGKWLEVQNLGDVINTPKEEDAPHVHLDGNTLYFSSTGHENMGGYDVFVSVFDSAKAEWSTPKNMGFPVNTSGDDIYFVWSGDGSRGYLSSEREGSLGASDIFVVERPKEEPNMVAIKGVVADSVTNERLDAEVIVTQGERKNLVGTFPVDPEDGRYVATVPYGDTYNLAVEADGYVVHEKEIEVAEEANYFEVTHNVSMKPFGKEALLAGYDVDPDSVGNLGKDLRLKEGTKMVFRNIQFDFDKAVLKPSSVTELDQIHKIMTDHMELVIEISGHTDSIGRARYNKRLSRRRAKVVARYIRDKGIKKNRLAPVGRGEKDPLASNGTPEGREYNRRVEIKVVDTKKLKEYGEELIDLDDEEDRKKLNDKIIIKGDHKVGDILPYMIHFPYNFYEDITDYSKGRLALVEKVLTSNPGMHLKIHSHADPLGSFENNKWVSQKRGETIVNYLVGKGIDKSRLQIASYGDKKPLVTTSDIQENVRNRRAEFEVIKL